MKKSVLGIIVFAIIGSVGIFAEDDLYSSASKEFKKAAKTIEDAKTVGESIGVISAYATHSDSFEEFANNVATHEFKTTTLQKAQEWGKEAGDFIADQMGW